MILKDYIDGCKKVMWAIIQPFHPLLRDGLLKLGIIHHHGRQQFHLGFLAPGKTSEALREYLLKEKGFDNHFPCWVDDGETVDLRFRQNFDWQYHLRIFEDGEVRGHHEYTPESRPIAHLRDRESTACEKEFLTFLGDWIVTDSRSELLTKKTRVCPECNSNIFPTLTA